MVEELVVNQRCCQLRSGIHWHSYAIQKIIVRGLKTRVYVCFFQAEDGIRDLTVTGVQTCALPIWGRPGAERRSAGAELRGRGGRPECVTGVPELHGETPHGGDDQLSRGPLRRAFERTLHERLRGKQGSTGRIDEGRDGRPCGGVEALEARLGLLPGRTSWHQPR